ncbi:MAG: beta-ketoacyl synthase N-terminal-like domain-containing protein, partial [Nitrosotalea sp.]
VMCAAASRIAIFENIKGSNTTFSSGRNSGLDAIGFAFLQIMFEEKQIIIAGGTEALSSKILKGLENEDLLFEVDQHKSFESKQGKFIPTEGASAVILCASDEGSQAFAEILAYNNSFAPYKKRDIAARIKTLSKNIQITLKDACLSASSIDAVIISSYFDCVDREVETGAIANIFSKSVLKQTPILGLKKALGENFSAFGAMQVVSAVGLLKNKFSKLSIYYFNLNPVLSTFKEFKHILIISLDSAGHNGSVIISSL